MRAEISSIPDTPLIASSIGSTTDVDISSGLAPGSDRVTLTVAGSAFGNRSTPRPRNEKMPSTTSDITSIVAEDRAADAEFRQHARLPTSYRLLLDGRRGRAVPSASFSTSVIATRSPALTPLDHLDAVAEALADLQLAHRQPVAVARRTRG